MSEWSQSTLVIFSYRIYYLRRVFVLYYNKIITYRFFGLYSWAPSKTKASSFNMLHYLFVLQFCFKFQFSSLSYTKTVWTVCFWRDKYDNVNKLVIVHKTDKNTFAIFFFFLHNVKSRMQLISSIQFQWVIHVLEWLLVSTVGIFLN